MGQKASDKKDITWEYNIKVIVDQRVSIIFIFIKLYSIFILKVGYLACSYPCVFGNL